MSLSKGPHVSEQGSPCLSARATPRPQSGLSIYRVDWEGRSGPAGCMGSPTVRCRCRTQEQGELLRYGVIDASLLNLALRLLLGPFYKDVLSYRSNRRREHGLVCVLGNNAATMGHSLVVITVHSPWKLSLFVIV